MLSQAGFPREEADVEICRQKSVCVGGWPGNGPQWGAKEGSRQRRGGLSQDLASPGLSGEL